MSVFSGLGKLHSFANFGLWVGFSFLREEKNQNKSFQSCSYLSVIGLFTLAYN